VAETMHELHDLSLQLNSASDTINTTITTLNAKLRSLNLGVEVWLIDTLLKPLPGDPRRDEIGPYLGYCSVEDQWQLAVRGEPNGSYCSGWTGDLPRTPLTKASREVRIAALEQLPALVCRIKEEAQRVLKAIQDARTLCTRSLTMDKNEILATILKGLADGFEAGNNRRRRTFTPATPDEEQSLREVLAELRADGSIDELAGTYQFTAAGYKKHKPQIDWLRATQGL
jgi:hypothetical protein